MIIDISEYQGVIDFDTLFKENKIDKVILRSTKKNGLLDAKCAEYFRQIRAIKGEDFPIDFYKFMYTTETLDAYREIEIAIQSIARYTGSLSGFTMWIDIEQINGREHSPRQVDMILGGAALALSKYDIDMGIYINYGYLKRNLSSILAKDFPIWLARYNSVMGDTGEANVVMWQYTSKGDLDGINGCVDISHYIEDGQVVL